MARDSNKHYSYPRSEPPNVAECAVGVLARSDPRIKS